MNILSVNKFYWRKGGSESVFFNEKKMLESAGHLVVPFSMHGKQNVFSNYANYFVDEVDYTKGGIKNKIISASKIIYSFDAKNKMQHLLSKFSPDIAHFHIFQHQISPSVFGPLKKKKIPIILTLHDLKPICPNYKMYVNGHICEQCKGQKFYNCFKNRCTKGSVSGSLINTIEMYFHYAMGYYQNVDCYIAVSQFYKNKMIEFGFPEEKISYLPNFVDLENYDPQVKEKNYILYFGRLSEEKGITVLIDAAEKTPEIPFYIVGAGGLENDLKKKKEEYNLRNIHFFGYKTGDELNKVLTESTCVVVPSEIYENCPMTILEAFAAGKPVIGSDIGGIPELINETIDGFTFQPGDSGELSEKIKWIWSNRDKAKKMGLQGRKKVEEKFNAESHYKRLMAIYKSVLDNKG